MKARYLLPLAYLLTGCGGGGSGGNNNQQVVDPQTYGGVNLPATAVYSTYDGANLFSGILRLSSDSSGIIDIGSELAELPFNLKGAVSKFNKNSTQCLSSTNLTGNIGNLSSTATVTLDNCVFSATGLTANIVVTSANKTIYSKSEFLQLGIVQSKSSVTQMSNALESNPSLYNYNTSIPLNYVLTTGGSNFSGATGNYGLLFGNLMQSLTSGITESYNSGLINGEITYTMIDSSSVNFTISNITTIPESSSVMAKLNKIGKSVFSSSSATNNQLQCNMILSGLAGESQLNNNFVGYISGCSGSVTMATGIESVNIVGNFQVN